MHAALLVASAALTSGPTNFRYFASCVGGVEPILANELRSCRIAATSVAIGRLGVEFEGNSEVGARAVLWSRTALRVMQLIGTREGIFTSGLLYEMVRDIDWDEFILNSQQTLSVQAVLGVQRANVNGRMRPGDWACNSCGSVVFASKDACFKCGAPRPTGDMQEHTLTHTHFSALTVKNAVVDAMRDRHGWRPSVDVDDPDVPLFLYVHKGTAKLCTQRTPSPGFEP